MTLEHACYACGRTAPPPAARCSCGEPLWVDTDATGFDWPDDGPDSMWRYREVLPVDPPAGMGSAAGGTPLVRTASLDDFAGARVHVKYEGANPTGSFKDRGSAVGVAGAVDAEAAAVGTVSHGNMAVSVAAAAASFDVPCVVLVPADIPPERLDAIAAFDPALVRVEGPYGDLYYESLDVGRDLGIRFVNSDTPLRVAGQKTTAYELCEAFAPDAPDAVVMPVSSGGHASGVWKAFRELAAAGRLDAPPRLYLVQSAACDPIAAAFRAGDDAVSAVTGGETIAYSIANADPPSGTRALTAARETGGGVCSVTDDEIRTARARLARDAGLRVEAASATSLAATRRLADRGEIARGEDVAVVATGSGYGESGAASPRLTALSELASTLSGLV
ncbi:MAG: pyridoxal-phosphate dependent enzyme [Haloferacaceae archaeon]